MSKGSVDVEITVKQYIVLYKYSKQETGLGKVQKIKNCNKFWTVKFIKL